MRRVLRTVITATAAAACVVGGIAMARSADAASLVEVGSFGNNPGHLRMHVYVPNNAASPAPIVLAMHGCGGSGPGLYSGSEFASLADRYGFIVIYPSASKKGNCFDAWSPESHRRDGGSDPVSLMSMITYTEQQLHGDPNRVYVTGTSSGGMETNIMLGNYPDVFKAGSAFMGVPHSCFADESDYVPVQGASNCASGRVKKSPQAWGDLVRAADPGFTGTRPRVQLWHGEEDHFVDYTNLQAEVDQWTNVFGLAQTPSNTDAHHPGWSRRQFADRSGTVQVEAYSAAGLGHMLPVPGMAQIAISFFGLDGSTPSAAPPGAGSPNPAPSAPAAGTPTTAPVTPQPVASPPAATPPGSSPATGKSPACTASYRVEHSWQGGYLASVTVSAAQPDVSSWTVTWDAVDGRAPLSVWNGQTSVQGSTVSVRNMPWNGRLKPGGTQFGLISSGSSTSAPKLTCTVGTRP
ncbi:MAG TPA: PHB depolymerase family esterase [Kineosporiaceae bacterium]|nr:PHB depolymerase family esterase [Kineosporiaceae bacterium]